MKGTTSQNRRRARRATSTSAAAARALPVAGTDREKKAAVAASLIAAGIAQPTLVTTYDLTNGGPSERFFYDQCLAAGHDEMSTAWWPTEAAELALDPGAVFRIDENDQVVRLKDGTLAHVRLSWGGMRVLAAGPSAPDAVAAFQSRYPASYLTMEPDGRVPITFWMAGSMGPIQRLRRIDAQPWGDIEKNYSAEVKAELGRVMGWANGADANGQLLLWQGEPGTGKTWALRALASEWSSWAEFHYITDPDAFFGKSAAYMIDVLLSDSYMAIDRDSGDLVEEQAEEAKWKVLILEDTGDLLASNARDSYSAGLSRLLNVVDGMIGQGLNVLALVTTNDQLDDFHPAVTRPGRCASQLSFGALSAEEASEWLGETVEEGGTLAELYARSSGGADASLAMGACANCDHAFSDHLGSAGPCTDGDCSCNGYQSSADHDGDEASSLEAAGPLVVRVPEADIAGARHEPIGEVFVRIRPDLSDFREEVQRAASEAFVERSLALERLVEAQVFEGIPEEHAETIRLRLRDLQISTFADGTTAVMPVKDGTPAEEDDGGATDPSIPDAHKTGETLPARRTSPQPPEVVDTDEDPDDDDEDTPVDEPVPDEGSGPANASLVRWTAILCPEGSPTDDGRVFAPGAITWRELPLTLMAMIETAPGHDGAQVAGRIDRIWKDGSNIMGEGVFDSGSYGTDISRMVADGTLRGVSVDIAILSFEIAYRSDVLDADGNWVGATATDAATESDDDETGLPDALNPDPSETMLVVWRGKIGAATVCPFPAFEGASIELASLAAGGSNPMHWRYIHDGDFMVSARKGHLVLQADLERYTSLEAAAMLAAGTLGQQQFLEEILDSAGNPIGVFQSGLVAAPVLVGEPIPGRVVTLVATGAPQAPPAEWFEDPDLGELTAVTIDDDGRIYGHAAAWDVCHIGIPDVCTTAPTSPSGYAYYHLKEVECEDGTRVSCGSITLDTGHAGRGLSRASAMAHYDDTGTVVADVVCGEDEFGIWFSGSVRPYLEEAELRKLRGSVLSGDWRNVNGQLELVALLCVNVPGFPIPRVRALVATGAEGRAYVEALVAAGVHQGGQINRVDQHRLTALLDVAEGRFDALLAEAETAAA